MKNCFLAIVLAVVTAGCSSPVDRSRGFENLHRGEAVNGLSLSVGDTVYTAPAIASVTLSNESGRSVGYNTCGSVRDQRTGSTWQRIIPMRLCTQELYILPPGEQITFEEAISDEWVPGEYRISLMVHPDGEPVTLSTGTFRVTD